MINKICTDTSIIDYWALIDVNVTYMHGVASCVNSLYVNTIECYTMIIYVASDSFEVLKLSEMSKSI